MIDDYKKEILEKLIAVYERRYHHNSDFGQKISIKFVEKGYEKYVAEDAYHYREEIDEAVRQAENEGFVHVIFFKGTHDISEVRLNIENVDLVYRWLGLTNIADRYQSLFDNLNGKNSMIAGKFATQLKALRDSGHSLQKYIEKTEFYMDALLAIETITHLQKDIYMRNLSVSLFRDSKRLENLESYIVNILQMTNEVRQNWDDFLLLNGVLKNPNYIFLKGDAVLQINEQSIDLKKLNTSMSICSDSIQSVNLICVNENKVTTIENLTTFHDYKGSELAIYLGGFSNHSKVELLKKFHYDIPTLIFRHFGDIDLGGFSILSHIRRETGIEIEALHMDKETLLQRNDLAKRPDSNYIKKLSTLLQDNYLQDCSEIINYMITHGVILEQETY